jgi:pyrimidine-nucleoside phosphorylase
MNTVEIIRKTRDRIPLSSGEINHLVTGAVAGTIPDYQISAWLMAVWIRGITLDELAALTQAMRFSGETFDPSPLGKFAVDKHSTGGIGDTTSFLVAPICAAAGLVVPMISGRALGHTGGTLDKLESIPGYNTRLSRKEMMRVLSEVGCINVGQTERLVPADRILYALRDVTSTVESPYLLCSSIMSKKLAAGLNGLVLDVKTGSGAFLSNEDDANFLAALMVKTGEAAGTRTVALVTDMNQPLGRYAGNAIEIYESLGLLTGLRDPLTEDTRELSLALAGWMLYIGGKADSASAGYAFAEQLLVDGSALKKFKAMLKAQGADASIDELEMDGDLGPWLPKMNSSTLHADRSGYIISMNTREIGLALQHLGAGRQRAEDTVSPNAGIEMHVKLGDKIEAGQPLVTTYSDDASRFTAAHATLRAHIQITDAPLTNPPKLIHRTITIENADDFMRRT